MRKKYFAFLLFIFASCFARGGLWQEAVSFEPRFMLKGAYANSSLPGAIMPPRYKTYAAQANLPVLINPADNIFIEADYFIRADFYNTPVDDGEREYIYNFQKAVAGYKNDCLSLTIGRQPYTPKNKEFIIYYGAYDNLDNTTPTALDGIIHTLQTKYISYDLLLAREVKKLSPNLDDSLIYGGALALGPRDIFVLDLYYYRRQTTVPVQFFSGQRVYETDLSVFGAGAVLKFTDDFEFSFYSAFNNGDIKRKLPYFTLQQDYKGRAFNGRLDMKGDNSFGKTLWRFNVYYGSAQDGDNPAYNAITHNLDMGFAFGGSSLMQKRDATSGMSVPGTQPLDLVVYSLAFDIAPHKIDGLNFKAAVYNFMTTADQIGGRSIGSEADFALSYAKNNLSLSLLYGIFISAPGYGEAIAMSPGVPSEKTLSKIGFNVQYGFKI